MDKLKFRPAVAGIYSGQSEVLINRIKDSLVPVNKRKNIVFTLGEKRCFPCKV